MRIGFGEGIAGGAKHGNEYLGLADLLSLSVDDRHGLAGVFDKQFFARTMSLAHDHINLGGPEPVVLAEPAVLEALRVAEPILLPEQGQGDAGAAQLRVSPCPVRHRTLIASGNRHRSSSMSDNAVGQVSPLAEKRLRQSLTFGASAANPASWSGVRLRAALPHWAAEQSSSRGPRAACAASRGIHTSPPPKRDCA